ncbi:hypothetical protein Tco_0625673 [Tanacetum coccineum]|uniref:Uncharacterized protein n=1 Tax=Tanacetum coccineum TaxID=301880 RepID=A0ABQ4WHI2_9ASTR
MTSMKLPPSKTSPLVDDDLDEEEAIKVTENKNLENNFEDETLEIDKIINIKESKNHPLENVKENLNKKTLRVWRQRHNFLATPSKPSRDDVKKCVTALECVSVKGLPCCLSNSSVRCLENVVEMSQADRAQSPRVPVPFPEDPYEAIRQTYLVETETPESPYIEASATPLIDSTPPTRHAEDSVDSDMSGARPTSLDFTTPLSPDHPLTHTTPTLVSFLRKTACMVVRVLPAMSHGLFVSIAEVEAMSDSAFCKRFRSSYESSPSSSPSDIPLRKRSWGTSELVEDGEEEDEDKEDEEVEESSYSNSKSEDAEDEGLAAEDEGPATGDEGLAAGDEGPGMRVESLGLGGDQAVPEGQQQATPVVETSMGEPLGLGYGALRRQEIASREGQMPSVFEVGQGSRSILEPERPERVSALRQPILTTWIDLEDDKVYIDVPVYPPPTPPVQTPPSPEWLSSLLLVSPAPSIVPSPISSPMIPLTVPSPVASPATAEAEGFLTELGAQVEMHEGLIHDHTVQLGELSHALFERYDRDIGELFTRSGAVRDEIFSQRYRFRSLEHEQERVAMTFGAIWRRVLALESWTGQTDAQRATLWHVISDT